MQAFFVLVNAAAGRLFVESEMVVGRLMASRYCARLDFYQARQISRRLKLRRLQTTGFRRARTSHCRHQQRGSECHGEGGDSTFGIGPGRVVNAFHGNLVASGWDDISTTPLAVSGCRTPQASSASNKLLD